jgi:hypothetical protein
VGFSKVGKLPDFQEKFGQGWNGTSYNVENGSWGPRLDGVVRPGDLTWLLIRLR